MIFEISDHELLPRPLWRELVIRLAGHRCEQCDYAPTGSQRLNAHHVDCNPVNHTLANGRALCAGCHREAHAVDRMMVVGAEERERIDSRNDGVRPYGTAGGLLDHIREKITNGKRLRRREYRAALAAMLYVPAELRPE